MLPPLPPPPPTPSFAPPLSDAEWAALAALLPRSRVRDLRHRMNCILAVAAHAAPWVPAAAQGPFWPTLYRHYHRWARAGVWARLHRAAGEAAAPPALRALAEWAAALHRRAARIAPPLQALNSSNPKPAARPTRPAPGPAPAAPPAGLNFLGPISGFNPLKSKTANPRCPEAFRPLAGWRGGAAPSLFPCWTPTPPGGSLPQRGRETGSMMRRRDIRPAGGGARRPAPRACPGGLARPHRPPGGALRRRRGLRHAGAHRRQCLRAAGQRPGHGGGEPRRRRRHHRRGLRRPGQARRLHADAGRPRRQRHRAGAAAQRPLRPRHRLHPDLPPGEPAAGPGRPGLRCRCRTWPASSPMPAPIPTWPMRIPASAIPGIWRRS